MKILDKGDAANCNAEFPRQSSIGEWSTTVTADTDFAAPGGGAKAHASGRGKGNASADQQRQAAGLLDEGRAAMRKERNGDAIAKFKQILSLPENESSASAQEYLALAYQRNKDTGQAKAEYEDYLARYPAGEGSERVRQRLSGLSYRNRRDDAGAEGGHRRQRQVSWRRPADVDGLRQRLAVLYSR